MRNSCHVVDNGRNKANCFLGVCLVVQRVLGIAQVVLHLSADLKYQGSYLTIRLLAGEILSN